MNLSEINSLLCLRNTSLDPQIKTVLANMKADAKASEDETLANSLWCYECIYSIQSNYYNAYHNMKNAVTLSDELSENGVNSPKADSYEAAWNELDVSDIEISTLEKNFCIPNTSIEEYHISEIKEDIQRLFTLFPYRLFTSRESIIKKEKCSICGQTVSIRHPCKHRVGALYMGEECCREVIDFQLLSVNIVTKPFDRYAIMKPRGIKFNFDLLDYIIPQISPYSKWSYNVQKRLLPQYKGIGRNDRCPCGSGKKYKYCIRDNTETHYVDHYTFTVS